MKEFNNAMNIVLREDILDRVVLSYMRKRKNFEYTTDKKDLKEWISDINYGIPTLHEVPKDNGKVRRVITHEPEDKIRLKIISNAFSIYYNDLICSSVKSYKVGIDTKTIVKDYYTKLKNKNKVVAKLDLTDFFMSIKTNVVIEEFNKLIVNEEDLNVLTNIFDKNKIIFNNDIKEMNLGLMPGCPLSSFASNLVLNRLDKFIESKSYLYCRYSDDMIIACDSLQELNNLIDVITDKLKSYGLNLNESKTVIFNPEDTKRFLGFEFSDNFFRLNSEKMKEIRKYIKSTINTVKYRNPKEFIVKTMRKLYGNQMNKSFPYGSKLFYFIQKCDNYDQIIELDYYIKDTLRRKLCGCNNKSIYNKIPNKLLKDDGYINLLDIVNLYKISKFALSQFMIDYDKNHSLTRSMEIPERFTSFNLTPRLISIEDLIISLVKRDFFLYNTETSSKIIFEKLDLDLTLGNLSIGSVDLISSFKPNMINIIDREGILSVLKIKEYNTGLDKSTLENMILDLYSKSNLDIISVTEVPKIKKDNSLYMVNSDTMEIPKTPVINLYLKLLEYSKYYADKEFNVIQNKYYNIGLCIIKK